MEKVTHNGVMASILMTLMLVCFSSCEEERMWDLSPVNIDIMLVDDKGENLLDIKTEGNWVGQPFSVTYEGVATHKVKWIEEQGNDPDAPRSRYDLAIFRGFYACFVKYWDDSKGWISVDGQYYLSFGEFPRDEDQDFSLQLNVPESDEVYIIDVTHRYKEKRGKPDSKTTIMLNGELVESLPIKIVLPHRQDNQ